MHPASRIHVFIENNWSWNDEDVEGATPIHDLYIVRKLMNNGMLCGLGSAGFLFFIYCMVHGIRA